MRSLFVMTAALCAVLYPFSSPCAQQTPPAASPAVTSPTTASAGPALDGASYRLTVLDGDGSRSGLLFQPVSEPRPVGRIRTEASAVATSAPVSPVQSTEPGLPQADAPGQSSPAPGRPTDLNSVPGTPLYAPPAAVETAWNAYAPRRMAYAPRAWLGPDPAVHSPLPVGRTPTKRAAGSGQASKNTARTPAGAATKTTAQTPVQHGFDALVSVVTALCPGQTESTLSGQGTVAPAATPSTLPAPAQTQGGATTRNPAAPR